MRQQTGQGHAANSRPRIRLYAELLSTLTTVGAQQARTEVHVASSSAHTRTGLPVNVPRHVVVLCLLGTVFTLPRLM